MIHNILITDAAADDLQEIYTYILQNNCEQSADYVLDAIESILESLSSQPHRGTHVVELKELGITEYRQIFYKSYRIIYRVIEDNVIVYLIADGRRNMQTYLSKRFFK